MKAGPEIIPIDVGRPPSNYPFLSAPGNMSYGMSYPPGFNYGYPQMPSLPSVQPRPVIKKILERFLHESEGLDKALLKMALYDFVVFVDTNYTKLNDPRVENRLFLAYCDEFDAAYLKPLLH